MGISGPHYPRRPRDDYIFGTPNRPSIHIPGFEAPLPHPNTKVLIDTRRAQIPHLLSEAPKPDPYTTLDSPLSSFYLQPHEQRIKERDFQSESESEAETEVTVTPTAGGQILSQGSSHEYMPDPEPLTPTPTPRNIRNINQNKSKDPPPSLVPGTNLPGFTLAPKARPSIFALLYNILLFPVRFVVSLATDIILFILGVLWTIMSATWFLIRSIPWRMWIFWFSCILTLLLLHYSITVLDWKSISISPVSDPTHRVSSTKITTTITATIRNTRTSTIQTKPNQTPSTNSNIPVTYTNKAHLKNLDNKQDPYSRLQYLYASLSLPLLSPAPLLNATTSLKISKIYFDQVPILLSTSTIKISPNDTKTCTETSKDVAYSIGETINQIDNLLHSRLASLAIKDIDQLIPKLRKGKGKGKGQDKLVWVEPIDFAHEKIQRLLEQTEKTDQSLLVVMGSIKNWKKRVWDISEVASGTRGKKKYELSIKENTEKEEAECKLRHFDALHENLKEFRLSLNEAKNQLKRLAKRKGKDEKIAKNNKIDALGVDLRPLEILRDDFGAKVKEIHGAIGVVQKIYTGRSWIGGPKSCQGVQEDISQEMDGLASLASLQHRNLIGLGF